MKLTLFRATVLLCNLVIYLACICDWCPEDNYDDSIESALHDSSMVTYIGN